MKFQSNEIWQGPMMCVTQFVICLGSATENIFNLNFNKITTNTYGWFSDGCAIQGQFNFLPNTMVDYYFLKRNDYFVCKPCKNFLYFQNKELA